MRLFDGPDMYVLIIFTLLTCDGCRQLEQRYDEQGAATYTLWINLPLLPWPARLCFAVQA